MLSEDILFESGILNRKHYIRKMLDEIYMSDQKLVDPLSARSLLLTLIDKDRRIGTATGFIIKTHDGRHYLITNWHVVTCLNPDTYSPINSTPDKIEILHHAKARLGTWERRIETLVSPEGEPRWREHPDGSSVDVVALPLQSIDEGIDIYPFDLSIANVDIVLSPAMPISIVGYPLGLSTGGNWPIWKTGHIASDPDLDYNLKPAFLIDATTRGGMSGSPVIVRMWGGFETKRGGNVMAMSGPITRFLGVYSGRIHEDSDIGMVWRPNVIDEILKHKWY